MAIPVYALGANPHSCAPLFYSKPDALKEGLKRLRIRKVGEFYFRAALARFIPGSKPYHVSETFVKERPIALPPAELPNLRFRSTPEMTRSRMESQVRQHHYLPRLEQQLNLGHEQVFEAH